MENPPSLRGLKRKIKNVLDGRLDDGPSGEPYWMKKMEEFEHTPEFEFLPYSRINRPRSQSIYDFGVHGRIWVRRYIGGRETRDIIRKPKSKSDHHVDNHKDDDDDMINGGGGEKSEDISKSKKEDANDDSEDIV